MIGRPFSVRGASTTRVASCLFWLCFVRGPPSGRSFSGTELARFAAGRASHRRACDLRNAAPCTGSMCGRPALGAKLFGHRAGAIRRGSRLPQKSARPARRSAMHGLDLWEARPRGEAVRAPNRCHSPRVAPPTEKRAACTAQRHARAQLVEAGPRDEAFGSRAGAIRRGSRLPQKSVRPAQRSAMHGLNVWEARPRGEAFRAQNRRHSPRVAAPTENACPPRNAVSCTDRFCGRPALGAKLFGHRAGAIRRGSRLPQKMRATRAMRCHALTAFVGGPPSGRSFSGSEPAPFAAGRGSPRKSARPA